MNAKVIFRLASLALFVGVFHLTLGSAFPQSYPTKPISFVCPWGPGTSTDVPARIIGEKLSKNLGQPVVVENRVGGAGIIGCEAVVKAPPDGYTIGIIATSIGVNSQITKVSFDLIKDFEPVIFIGTSPVVLIAHPSVPATSVRELVALAKSKPGKLNCAAGALGGTGHVWLEMFKMNAGIDIVPIFYKNTPDAIADVLEGRVDIWLPNTVAALPHYKAGKVKALGLSGTYPKRSLLMPEVPTMTESGFPDMDKFYTWLAIVSPAGTPKRIVTQLNSEIRKILEMPDVKERMVGVGVELRSGTPEELSSFLKAEMERLGKMIKAIKDTGVRFE